MTPRRVRFTATARRHVEREKAWWLQYRDYQDLFATEVEAAVKLLAILPGAGASYPHAHVPGLRRVYLDKLVAHLYYTFDPEEVVIRGFWGARRERGPNLR